MARADGCAIFFGLTLLCSSAFAKDWVYCRSAHFESYREVVEAADAACDLEEWEAYRHLFSFVYGPMAEKARLVRVITFHHLRGREGSDSPVGRGDALFIRSTERDYLVVRESRPVFYVASTYLPGEEPFQDPYEPPRRHDKRAYIRLRLSEYSLPMWFAGGLEALYMGVRRRDGKMFLPDVGEVESPRIDKLLSAKDGTPKTMGVTAFSDRRKRYRAKAQSLTSMLHTHPEYREGYREFFSTLAGGASSEEAFQRVYGKSPERVDQDLREYRAARRSGEFSTSAQPAGPHESVRRAALPEETAMLEDLRTALATGQVERFK